MHDYRHPEFVEEVFRICAARTAKKSIFVVEGIRCENKNGNGDALYYNMRTRSLAQMEAKHHKEFVQFIKTGIEISDEKFLEELKYCGFLIEDD